MSVYSIYPRSAASGPNSITTPRHDYWQNFDSAGNPGSVNNSGITAPITEYVYSYYQGAGIRGYRKYKSRGDLLPMLPWKQFHAHGSTGGVQDYWRVYDDNSSTHYWTDGPACAAFSEFMLDADSIIEQYTPDDLQKYVDQAAANLYNRGWDTLSFLTELHKTRQMFFDILKKIEKLTLKKSPEAIHNLWLEGRYGWRTLKYDIEQFIEQINGLMAKDNRTRFTARSGDRVVYNLDPETVASGHGAYFDYLVVASDVIQIEFRGSITADMVMNNIRFQANPIQTIWEVTRLSFVVDWLLNVGGAIAAGSLLVNAQDYTACGGFILSATRTLESTFTGTDPYLVNLNRSQYGSSSVVVSQRVPKTVSIVPHFQFRLDALKYIDLAALVIQRVYGRGKVRRGKRLRNLSSVPTGVRAVAPWKV